MSRVLVVDDISDYLDDLELLLSEEHQVVRAASAEEARKILDTQPVDVALVDIRLDENDEENVDGLELLRWMRGAHPSVRVVMMSAYKEFDYAVEALNAGGEYFLRKPLRPDEVTSILQRVLSRDPR
jgi:DNA-binding NtrC family response regulator